MARIHPHGWRELGADSNPTSQALHRQIDTLARLADALPETFTIYHGVHWTRIAERGCLIDDIDFLIVAPDGRMLLIEQVAGFLDESPQGLLKKRPGGDGKELAHSLAATVATLGGRLRRALSEGGASGLPPPLEVLLYCPDYTVRTPGSAGLPPERIVDATRRDALPEIIIALLSGDGIHPLDEKHQRRVHRFFADLLQLAPEPSAIVGEAHALSTRLAGGLAQWARQLDFAPHRLRVVGTAGSGKTQLALAVIADALAAGRKPLYVCYNRPLADHISTVLAEDVANGRVRVGTFHQICDQLVRAAGQTPDFTQADAFQRLETAVDALPADLLDAHRCDDLIVDEGQDFQPDWATTLFRLLAKPAHNARVWWLEDPLQNLYGRPPLALPEPNAWVTLRAEANYRSPRAIIDVLGSLLGDCPPFDQASLTRHAASPLAGRPPEILSYRNEEELFEQTKRAIGLGIAAGFRRQMIALLTYRGREHSRLHGLEKLGPYALRSFTGRYDLLGQPIYREGEIALDSVMRFKGQAAPCVVLSEVELPSPDDETSRRRLFVGATRATMMLVIVAAEETAQRWQSLLGATITITPAGAALRSGTSSASSSSLIPASNSN